MSCYVSTVLLQAWQPLKQSVIFKVRESVCTVLFALFRLEHKYTVELVLVFFWVVPKVFGEVQ